MRAGSLLVRFRPNTSAQSQNLAHDSVGARAVEPLRLPNTTRIKVAQSETARALAAYLARADVVWAEPDYLMRAASTPDDPYFPRQWNLNTIGAAQAWDFSRSAPQVTIAVLDCGVYSLSSSIVAPDGFPGHPDLRAKVIAEQNFTVEPDVDDFCNHGTHVAGVAAAVTNNGIGVAGVGYDASVLNGKVLGDDGVGTLEWAVAGIMWAADLGAMVISLGFAETGPCPAAMQDAVDYAWAAGAVIVAPAGNDGVADVASPANCDRVLAVAATGLSDERAPFSNYGPTVALAAPGVLIFSTDYVGDYPAFRGTSRAAAHVAGAAALTWTTGFGTSNQSVVDRLCGTADPVAGTGTLWNCGRLDAAAATAPEAGLYQATIVNYVYIPDPVVVPVGATIRWTNRDADAHTVTAEDRSWTSPQLLQGDTYARTFATRGTFNYYCEPHPFMLGTVTVR